MRNKRFQLVHLFSSHFEVPVVRTVTAR